jgi:hypothetical protein
MPWDQGPYPVLDDVVQQVTLQDAPTLIRERRIECVYSLFQAYDRGLWAAPGRGVEHGVWRALAELLAARSRGVFDVPIVRHWGFDVHELAPQVARAVDGHIVCNEEKLRYWIAPRADGGCGLDVFDEAPVLEVFDSDRPKLEFMHDRFSERYSDATGEIHTVCAGRPFGIDYLAAAREGIHVHVYGNAYDDAQRALARAVNRRRGADRRLLQRFLHAHASYQVTGATWPDVRRAKNQWVPQFSRYDAGWSYIGTPFRWRPLDDRAAIPNRLSTYMLAGLPIVTDRRPGYFRFDEVQRLGVGVELVDADYGRLRTELETEIATRRRHRRALEQRRGYSFDASADRLLGTLERARERYFNRPGGERTRYAGDRSPTVVDVGGLPSARVQARRLRRRLARR